MAFYHLKKIENRFEKKKEKFHSLPYPQLVKFAGPPLLSKVDVQNKPRPNLVKYSCSENFINFPRKYPPEVPHGFKLS